MIDPRDRRLRVVAPAPAAEGEEAVEGLAPRVGHVLQSGDVGVRPIDPLRVALRLLREALLERFAELVVQPLLRGLRPVDHLRGPRTRCSPDPRKRGYCGPRLLAARDSQAYGFVCSDGVSRTLLAAPISPGRLL